MTSVPAQLDRLAVRLLQAGVAGFCPTTLSASRKALHEAVARLGSWICSTRERSDFQGARPLGIHLEGPYIAKGACGAHPARSVRRYDAKELGKLWEASRHTLKILTIAPEILTPAQLRGLAGWCKKRKIRLSLGHSRATQKQAAAAFQAGFTGLTHSWNAMPFHHRAPGPLGAALGKRGVYVELIPDGIHVDPAVIRWTRTLHPHGVCFISDCVPSTFGGLRVVFKNGASRLPSGELAGGGRPLAETFARWIETEAWTTALLKKERSLWALWEPKPGNPAKAPSVSCAGASRTSPRFRFVPWV